MMRKPVIYGTPWRLDEEVGYSLKVVNGIRYANSSLGGQAAGQSTVGGCYQVNTPSGEIYLKAWTPSYYNPPLAYDRCAVPRPLGPQYGASETYPCKLKGSDFGGNGGGPCGKCGRGGSGGCGSGGCGSSAMRNVPCNSCGCGLKKKSYKNGLLGFLGESDAIIGPDYRAADYLYQSGYYAPEVVNGRMVGQTAQVKKKDVALKLLMGDYDSVMSYLLAQGKFKNAVNAVSGPVAPKQPLPDTPIQMMPLINEPRAYMMLYTPQCQSLGNMSASISERFADMMDVLSESRQICSRKYQGMENPFGQVQGYVVGQPSMKSNQLTNLADVIILSAGINPKKAQLIRKMVAKKLTDALRKRGVTVKGFSDGTLIVCGPRLVGQELRLPRRVPASEEERKRNELEDLATNLAKSVDETNKFMHDEVLKEVAVFAKDNASTLKGGLKDLEESFGLTDSLKKFAKDNLSDSKSDADWSKLAGLALLALTGGTAKQSIEAIADTAKQGSPIKDVAKSMTQLVNNTAPSDLGDKIAALIGKGGPEVTNSVNQIMKGLAEKASGEGKKDPIDVLMGGQKGLADLLTNNVSKDAGNIFDVLSQIGAGAVKDKKLDFGNLLGSLAKVASDKGLGGELNKLGLDKEIGDLLSKLVSGKLARAWWVSGCGSGVRTSVGRILRDISQRCLNVGG